MTCTQLQNTKILKGYSLEAQVMRATKFETCLQLNSNLENHDIELRRQRRRSLSSISKKKNHSKAMSICCISWLNSSTLQRNYVNTYSIQLCKMVQHFCQKLTELLNIIINNEIFPMQKITFQQPQSLIPNAKVIQVF